MPRAEDFPDMVSELTEVPATTNPLGIKGAGEAGATGAPPAVISAILDALKPLGIEHIDMPATPSRVWAAINARRDRKAGAE
jgi:carbon-monoxide dehydrogenase large subunit